MRLARRSAGPQFLPIPGPVSVPPQIGAAMLLPPVDHRSPEFLHLARSVSAALARVFGASGPVMLRHRRVGGSEPAVLGMLGAMELGLVRMQIPHRSGAIDAAVRELEALSHA